MKRLLLVIMVLSFAYGYIFAQAAGTTTTTLNADEKLTKLLQKESGTKETSEELIKTVIVDDFEDAGTWFGEMPRDEGLIFTMKQEGAPMQVKAEAPAEKFVLAVKVEYMRRGYNHFTLRPPREIKIPGLCKSISLWVCGRNYQHTLSIIIKDFLGRLRYLTIGKVNHIGWKKMTVNIPTTIMQENYKLTKERGITFVGLRVDCNPEETSGKFFIYFDHMTAETDMFNQENVDKDDMRDFW